MPSYRQKVIARLFEARRVDLDMVEVRVRLGGPVTSGPSHYFAGPVLVQVDAPWLESSQLGRDDCVVVNLQTAEAWAGPAWVEMNAIRRAKILAKFDLERGGLHARPHELRKRTEAVVPMGRLALVDELTTAMAVHRIAEHERALWTASARAEILSWLIARGRTAAQAEDELRERLEKHRKVEHSPIERWDAAAFLYRVGRDLDLDLRMKGLVE